MAVEERDRRSEILSAAFGEFSEKGFKGATIKSIARNARLQSPALIYWYFEDKAALFREVLASQIPVVRAVSDPEAMMELPPEEVLRLVGGAYLGMDSVQTKSRMQLIIGEVIRDGEVAEAFVEAGPGRVISFLETYFQGQIEEGVFRPHDVHTSARSFIGMLMPRLAGNLFLHALNENGPSDEEYLETCIEIFLRGIREE